MAQTERERHSMNTSRIRRVAGSCLVLVLGAGSAAGQAVNWTGLGDGVNWEDPNNWSTNALPGASDLVFSGGGGRTVSLSSNQEVDAFRFTNGDSLVHTSGTLTVGTGSTRTVSGFPEFGPASSSYTMSGTAAYNQTDGGRFIMGQRAGLTLRMTDNTSISNTGALWLGMDGTFDGNLSGNASLVAGGTIQMARFASTSSVLRLSEDASVDADGFFVMSDDAVLSGDSLLEISGSDVSFATDGLFMREAATLSFIADGYGLSTLFVDGPGNLVDNGGGMNPQLLLDLSSYTVTQPITLIDMSTGPVNGMFRGLAEGAVVAGTGGLTITYQGGADGYDVMLIPAPASAVCLTPAALMIARRRR
ncbi:MAG: hypothetical protein AAGG07_13965 [Planctomycetota bacterium]